MATAAASMVALGLVWGATNTHRLGLPLGLPPRRWWANLLTLQYSAPFLANLSTSAAFFRLLDDAPISVAVPVTNTTTFAAALLREATRAAPALLGTALIVLSVWDCIS